MPKSDPINYTNSSDLSNIYFIHGSDSWMKRQYLQDITNKINLIYPDISSNNFYKLNGENLNISTLLDICETSPLTGVKKFILIKEWPLDTLSLPDYKIVKDLLANLPPFCIFIIANIITSVNPSKIKDLIDIISKHGSVVNLSASNINDIISNIQSITKDNNCLISYSDSKKLALNCSSNMDQIYQELSKLCNYCRGSGKITSHDLDMIVSTSSEVNIFDINKYIYNKNYVKAVDTLRLLLEQKTEAITIFSIIVTGFADVYRAKISKSYSKSPAELNQIFNNKIKDFRLNNAFSVSTKYTLLEIKNIINILVDTDVKLKSSNVDKNIILEECITKIFCESK